MSIKNLINVSKRSLKCPQFGLFSQVLNRFDFSVKHLLPTKRTSIIVISRRLVSISYTMRGGSKADFKRLPTSVTPINYGLTLRPNLKSFTFTGRESIKVKVNEKTNTIVLNALELEITVASFTPEGGKSVSPKKIEISKESETVSLQFDEPLNAGNGSLSLEFNGTISEKLRGFYRSKYTAPDGSERYAATTHFEATDARRAFPCWDEPALKATFDITLVVPSNRIALSNMNVISSNAFKEDPQNLKEVKFATSPIMSTYLVAFVIGEFDYVEGKSSDGVTVRVYTPVGKKDQGQFGLECAVKALPFYKDYFNIAYPLPKMDLIAIADFEAGAMENWGLVTYRETCLLVDPQNTSSNRKQWIALVVAHELAHQWFGNLVTMEWWTHLWLNEGFASFIEYLCVDHLFAEYQIWTQFVTDTYTAALDADSLHNSHPIEVPVGHPSEIDEIFDDISYNKGACVIRMLHRFIGDELFRKGMNLYLTRHSYKNTMTEDLWDALEEASGKPVRAVMSTWTKQKGYPVISVSSRSDGGSRVLSLSQEKFCADGKLPDSEQNMLWMIPLAVSKASSPEKITAEGLMESKTFEIEIPKVGSNEWTKLNPSAVGVYRVQYSSDLLNLLLPAVADKKLPPLDRLDLMDDLFALVQAGRTSTVEILKLMDAFVNEDNYTVWNSINSCLGRLNILLSHTELQPLFHEYGRRLLSKIHSQLGWEVIKGESHLNILLRTLVITRLASFEDPMVISHSKKLFESHCNGTAVIPADLRAAVYRAVAMDCDDKTFDALFKLYRNTDLHEEKDRVSRALGSVKDPNRIRKVLEFALTNEVRSQDTVFVIISVALTKNGRELAWQFFQENKDEFKKRYEGGFLISRLIKYIAENFASEEKARELESFFAQNPFPGTERTVQQSLETVRLNAEWLSRDLASIQSYLSVRQ